MHAERSGRTVFSSGSGLSTTSEAWPPLPIADWEDTRATLHRWTQMVGKTRLALSPPQNHCWHVALYVTSRGLGTSPIPFDGRTFEIEFDFIDHLLVARTSDGAHRTIPLEPQSVADFYDRYRDLLRALEIEARIWPMPSEIVNPVPFTRDREHATYDRDAVNRFQRILVQVDRALKRYRGPLIGKCSPVHFWWGAMDLACTSFSGRPAPQHPGGFPNLPDRVTRDAYSHECVSVGWWPGSAGTPLLEPSFYAYAYPEPAGFAETAMSNAAAAYDQTLKEWMLPYDAVRRAPDPEQAVIDFARGAYEAAASIGGWDGVAVER